MKDVDCVAFLQWALPRLRMRWSGFRKVRKRVCRRIARRLAELGLPDLDAYRTRLARDPREWPVLDRLCRVVISRFYRDKLVFARLAEQVLPALAARSRAGGGDRLRCWSVGSASGEEPYTLAILWQAHLAPRFPGLRLHVLGTEVEPELLQRSERACYATGTVRNLPAPLREQAFDRRADLYCLRPQYRRLVEFRRQDVRDRMPDGPFELILCRNLVFTYLDDAWQRQILEQLLARLVPGGWLVLGVRERLPAGAPDLVEVSQRLGLYRKPARPSPVIRPTPERATPPRRSGQDC